MSSVIWGAGLQKVKRRRYEGKGQTCEGLRFSLWRGNSRVLLSAFFHLWQTVTVLICRVQLQMSFCKFMLLFYHIFSSRLAEFRFFGLQFSRSSSCFCRSHAPASPHVSLFENVRFFLPGKWLTLPVDVRLSFWSFCGRWPFWSTCQCLVRKC